MMEGVHIEVLYFLIGLLASIFGSIAGIGGGVIIKPVVDSFGHYDVATISIVSTTTVLSMACVSLIKAALSKIQLNIKVSSILAFSSIAGGIIVKMVFINF